MQGTLMGYLSGKLEIYALHSLNSPRKGEKFRFRAEPMPCPSQLEKMVNIFFTKYALFPSVNSPPRLAKRKVKSVYTTSDGNAGIEFDAYYSLDMKMVTVSTVLFGI